MKLWLVKESMKSVCGTIFGSICRTTKDSLFGQDCGSVYGILVGWGSMKMGSLLELNTPQFDMLKENPFSKILMRNNQGRIFEFTQFWNRLATVWNRLILVNGIDSI